MDNADFDRALVASAFRLAAERGWTGVSVAQAARDADLPLDQARRQFPGRGAVLARFGSLADQAALALATTDGAPRDRLFDLMMRRIDFLQAHRPGMLALLRHLPYDPPTALALALASECSMAWMLEAAGISSRGLRGRLRRKALFGVWLWTVRAWQRDDSQDLAATMAALDEALSRAETAEGWLGGARHTPAAPRVEPTDQPPSGMPPEEPPASPPV